MSCSCAATRSSRRGLAADARVHRVAAGHSPAARRPVANFEEYTRLIRWRFVEEPTFDNQIATIDIEGRAATLTIERTLPGEHDEPPLREVFRRRLT